MAFPKLLTRLGIIFFIAALAYSFGSVISFFAHERQNKDIAKRVQFIQDPEQKLFHYHARKQAGDAQGDWWYRLHYTCRPQKVSEVNLQKMYESVVIEDHTLLGGKQETPAEMEERIRASVNQTHAEVEELMRLFTTAKYTPYCEEFEDKEAF